MVTIIIATRPVPRRRSGATAPLSLSQPNPADEHDRDRIDSAIGQAPAPRFDEVRDERAERDQLAVREVGQARSCRRSCDRPSAARDRTIPNTSPL